MDISPSSFGSTELWSRDSPCKLMRCPEPSCSHITTMFSPIELAAHKQEQHPDFDLWLDNLGSPPTLSPPQPTPSEIIGSDVYLSQSSDVMVPTSSVQEHIPAPIKLSEHPPSPYSFATIDDIQQVGLVADVMSTFQVHEMKGYCLYSPFNKYYHIKGGMDGKMAMDINFINVPQLEAGETLFITMKLKRNHYKWKAVLVDTVCQLHCQMGAVQHVILPALGEENTGRYYNDFCPQGSSVLYYQCLNPIGAGGSMSETVAVRFPCLDSCQNSSKHKLDENAKDYYMEIQLEKRTADDIRSVLHHFTFNTWIGKQMTLGKLEAPSRRKPKGAAAQLAGKKRRLEAQAAIKTELDDFDTETWIQQGKRLIREGKLTPKEAFRRLQVP